MMRKPVQRIPYWRRFWVLWTCGWVLVQPVSAQSLDPPADPELREEFFDNLLGTVEGSVENTLNNLPTLSEQTAARVEGVLDSVPDPENMTPELLDKLLQDLTTAMAPAEQTPDRSNAGQFAPGLNAGVNAFSGTFTASIPLALPPGRSNLQPNLSLSYAHTGGLSWLGRGWDLGVGAIMRTGPRKRVPSRFEAVQSREYYVSLPGASGRLVPVDQRCYDPSGGGCTEASEECLCETEYRTRVESWNKIVHHTGSSGSEDLGWEIWTKHGLYMRFGCAPDARIESSDPFDPDALQWLLEYVEDPNGNYMTYSYRPGTNSTNQLYLHQIRYTGNTHTGAQPQMVVEFQLEPMREWLTAQPWRTSRYRLGVPQELGDRLAAVEIRAAGNRLWRYELEHSPAPFLHLTRVRQFGEDGVTQTPVREFQHTIPGDFLAPELAFALPIPGLPFARRDSGTELRYGTGARLADVNGDGLPDKVDHFLDKGTVTRATYLHTGTGWSPTPDPTWAPPGRPFTERAQEEFIRDQGVRLADLNGDGLPEKVEHSIRTQGGTVVERVNRVYWNTGNGWDPTPQEGYFPVSLGGEDPFSENGESTGATLADINGDGLAEKVTLRKGLESLADMNGDGLPDIARGVRLDWVRQEAYVPVFLNVGGRFEFTEVKWQIEPPGTFFRNPTHANAGTVFVDVDGDGLADLVHSANRDGKTLKFVVQNRGDRVFAGSFGAGGLLDGDPLYPDSGTVIQDLDGNGLPDMVQSFTNKGTRIDAVHSNRNRPALIYALTNGIGGTTQVRYRPAASFPNTHLPQSYPVVTELTVEDGRGQAFATRYEYAGGLYDGEEAEFQGFRTARTIEGATGHYTDTHYLQAFPFTGLEEGAEQFTAAGARLLTTLSTYDQQQPDPAVDRHVVLRTAADQMMYEDGAFQFHHSQSWQYDAFGNVTLEVNHGDAHVQGDELAIQTEYLNDDQRLLPGEFCEPVPPPGGLTLPCRDVVLWRIGLPTHQQTVGLVEDWRIECEEAAFPGLPSPGGGLVLPCRPVAGPVIRQLQEKFFYYDDLRLGQYEQGNLTKVEEWLDFDSSTGTPLVYVPMVRHTYWPDGNLRTTTDALGRVTLRTYDPLYRTYVSQVVNPLGHVVAREYNDRGQVIRATDPNGVVSLTDYDAVGRVIAGKVDFGTGPKLLTETVYPPFSVTGDPQTQHVETRRYETLDGPRFLWTREYFDGMGRTYQTEAKGEAGKIVVTETQFNDRGLAARASKPRFAGEPAVYTTTEYDARGRVVRVTNPDGSFTTTSYQGYATTVRDPNGKKITRTVDAHGRTEAVTEYTAPDTPGETSHTTRYRYDPVGNLVEVIDAEGHSLARLVYDSFNRKLRLTEADSGTTEYAYDHVGNLLSQTDAKGQAIQFAYDALDRATAKVRPEDTTTYHYDDPAVAYATGRLTRVESPVDAQTFGYDPFGRIISTTRQVTLNGVGYTFGMTTEYDALGRPTRLVYPDGTTVRSFYNDGGLLDRVTDDSQTLIYARFPAHTAAGQILELQRGNGVRTSYDYHPLNDRLNQLQTVLPGNLTAQQVTYQFDAVGNITAVEDLVDPVKSQLFAYDDSHRLVGAQGGYGSKGYGYSVTGNLVQKDGVSFQYLSQRPHAVTQASDGATWQYDRNGNVVQSTSAGSLWQYQWDSENRLTRLLQNGAERARYVYDGDGVKLKKITPDFTRLYIGDVFEVQTRPGGFLLTKHIFAGNHRIASITHEETLIAFATQINPHGSQIAASQFTPWHLRGLIKKGQAWIAAGVASKTATDWQPFLGLFLVLLAFGGLCTLSRRRGAQAHLARVGWLKHRRVFAATARLVILALLLHFSVVPGVTPPAYAATELGTLYYASDHLGSAALVTDDTGTVVERVFYTPYGEIWHREGAESTTFYFTDQEKELSLGPGETLYDCGARFYNTKLGRFLSPDSIVQSPFDPQTLNRYMYARGNPVIYVDPTGQFSVLAAVLIGAVLGGLGAVLSDQNIAMGIALGAFMGAFTAGLPGPVAGSISGAVSSQRSGGDLLWGAVIGAGTGWLGGRITGAGVDSGFGRQVAGAAIGGAVGGALGAAVGGGNVLQGFAVGAATGAAFASIGYGLGRGLGAARNRVGSGDDNRARANTSPSQDEVRTQATHPQTEGGQARQLNQKVVEDLWKDFVERVNARFPNKAYRQAVNRIKRVKFVEKLTRVDPQTGEIQEIFGRYVAKTQEILIGSLNETGPGAGRTWLQETRLTLIHEAAHGVLPRLSHSQVYGREQVFYGRLYDAPFPGKPRGTL